MERRRDGEMKGSRHGEMERRRNGETKVKGDEEIEIRRDKMMVRRILGEKVRWRNGEME